MITTIIHSNKNRVSCLIVFLSTFLILLHSACRSDSEQRPFSNDHTSADSTGLPGNQKDIFSIYIDNSASMDGYLTPGSDFKNTLLTLITDLKSKGLTETINLFFINQQICPQKIHAQSADLINFVNTLEPASFVNSGCGRHDTYLPNILKTIITNQNDDIHILVTDAIFSDSTGTSPLFLGSAESATKLFFSDALKKKDFSSIILKFSSQFQGRYYVEAKRPQYIDLSQKAVRRPYYLFVFGPQRKIHRILTKLPFDSYPHFDQKCLLLPPTDIKPPAKLIRNNRIGEFEIVPPASSLTLENAKAGSKNGDDSCLQFSLIANLDQFHLDETYIQDPANYEVAGNYTLTSVSTIDNPDNASTKGFTHQFTLRTTTLRDRQQVSLRLRPARLPSWIQNSSTIDDSNPTDSAQQHKTFGLEYLARGMSAAYADTYNGKNYFSLQITVNRNKTENDDPSHPGWVRFLVIGVILLGAILIWLKNKK